MCPLRGRAGPGGPAGPPEPLRRRQPAVGRRGDRGWRLARGRRREVSGP